jgi:hypothetical protein
MDAKELIRLPDPRNAVRAELREVVRDRFGRPHVFLRIRLTGWHFPHRAPKPFVVIGDVVSHHVVIDRDGLGANAYFDRPLPRADRITFGYGRTIAWDFNLPIDPQRIPRLERPRLPNEAVDPFSGQPS